MYVLREKRTLEEDSKEHTPNTASVIARGVGYKCQALEFMASGNASTILLAANATRLPHKLTEMDGNGFPKTGHDKMIHFK